MPKTKTKSSAQKPQKPQSPQNSQNSSNTKTGRNDPCSCGSKKKYKKCCQGRSPSEIRANQRLVQHNAFTYGHEMSGENVKAVTEWLTSLDKYKKIDLRTIEITEFLTPFNFQAIQMKHYFADYGYTVICAERAPYSELVFMTRNQKEADVILMFRGVYIMFDFKDFEAMKGRIMNMIDLRLEIERPPEEDPRKIKQK